MSRDELRRVFSYDKETGVLYWNWRPESDFSSEKEWKRFVTRRVGAVAGSTMRTSYGKRSKVQICYAGKTRAAHRIIWRLVHGVDPDGFIDHINGNPFDNRMKNLRLSDDRTNQFNRGVPSNNTTGIKGVTWSKQLSKWKATLRANGKYFHLGYYGTKGEAAVACAKGSIRHHGLHSVYLRSINLSTTD